MHPSGPGRAASPSTPAGAARAWAVAVLVALAMAGCGARLPPATPELAAVAQKRWPDLDVPKLESARQLYIQRCSSCHWLVEPRSETEKTWPTVIESMAKKAKITPAQQDQLLRYVLSVRDFEIAEKAKAKAAKSQ